MQACPNEKYHVISLGLLNEHDTAKPLLITTADVIKLNTDSITNIGYIIPQSKISQQDLEKLSKEIGEAIIHEQYIGFYGIDIIVFENKSNVRFLNSIFNSKKLSFSLKTFQVLRKWLSKKKINLLKAM